MESTSWGGLSTQGHNIELMENKMESTTIGLGCSISSPKPEGLDHAGVRPQGGAQGTP